ncbi:MAG: phasin family protein [Oceanidesulfovibrio sp.]
MDNIFKNGFLFGLGAGLLIKDGLEESVEELLAKGKEKANGFSGRGEKFIDQLKGYMDELEIRGKGEVESALHELGLVSRREYEALLARVEQLETSTGHRGATMESDV